MDREAEDARRLEGELQEYAQGCHKGSQLRGLPWTLPQGLALEVGIFSWPGAGPVPMPSLPGSREEGVSGPLAFGGGLGLDSTKMCTVREYPSIRTGPGSWCIECCFVFCFFFLPVYAYCFYRINS